MFEKKQNYIIQFILGLIISISCLYFALKDFKFSEFIFMLKNIDLFPVFIATLLLILSVYIRSLRWKVIVYENKISVKDLFVAQFIGYFGNNVLPFRLGELIRSKFIAKKYNFSTPKIFGTVVLERTFDILGIMFLAIILAFQNFSLLFNYKYTIFLLPLLILTSIIILFSLFSKIFFYEGKNKFFLILINIINGIKSLKMKNLVVVIFHTVLIWIIYIVQVYLVQYSVNMNMNLSDCIFLLFVSSLILSIPSLPANIGTFEAGVIEALKILNISSYQSSFPFLLHSMTFIPYVLIGGLLFLYYNYQVFHKE